MVTPMTQKFFNFGELENSIMYCMCGVEVIAGFLFVRWLSMHVAERVVLAVGLILCNISCVWCLIFLANPLGKNIQQTFFWLRAVTCLKSISLFFFKVDLRGSWQSLSLGFFFRSWASLLWRSHRYLSSPK